MRIESVVVNASPLIAMFRSGQADLLPQLFSRIVIPDAVWNEVVDADKNDRAAKELASQTWPIRESIATSPRIESWNLGAGETSVLSYALANHPLRAVIDDAAARRCAKTLNIPVLGTGGVLILAKRRGLIASVNDGLKRLRDAGLWLSDELIDNLKLQAGE